MLPKIKTNIKNKPDLKAHHNFDFIMYFDGCSKGNPGIAGAGAVIYNSDIEIWSKSLVVGENATNNFAEYSSLILGMEKAIELGIQFLLIKGDSLLVINHMNGTYKCKSQNLIDLYKKAKELEKKFTYICYKHVLRNFNKRADDLANIAIKKYFENMYYLEDFNN